MWFCFSRNLDCGMYEAFLVPTLVLTPKEVYPESCKLICPGSARAYNSWHKYLDLYRQQFHTRLLYFPESEGGGLMI